MDRKEIVLYGDGALDRREFLKKLAYLSGGTAAAFAVLPMLEKNRAEAQIIPKADPRIVAEHTEFTGATGKVRAYLAKPKGEDGKLPGVVVIHENRGLNAHIEDVTRRVALEGYVAFAPDALSPVGGTPDDPDKARSLIEQLDGASTVQNFTAAIEYLKTHPSSTGRVGVVGFCWGGAMANQVAVHAGENLAAAVPYYGRQPASEEVPKIKASLLLHYAGIDERINSGIPAYEDALKAASVDYKIFIYEGALHAFNNDMNPERYNREAAQLAWQRTISFFEEKLK
jgi:carboxymethylenebutenolidase